MELLSEKAIQLVKEILAFIDKVTSNYEKFDNEFNKLKHTLQALLPWIEYAKKFNKEMTDQDKTDSLTDGRWGEIAELVHVLKDCEELIIKCTELPAWKFFRVKVYAEQLSSYNEALRASLATNMISDVWEATIATKPVNTNFVSALPEPSFTVGWEAPVAELKQKLFQEDANLIGICGLGGSGKTTLVAKLCEQVRDKFQKIIFLPISKSPHWIEMVRRLWMDLVNASTVPKFVSVEDALQQLMFHVHDRKLEEDAVLVVLDDVWSQSVLEKIIIEKWGFKTIVTSRMEFKKLNWTYHVPDLKMEDAKALFLHYALLPTEDSKSLDAELVNVVEQIVHNASTGKKQSEAPSTMILKGPTIVRGCYYHPLSLKVIGASLEDKWKWKETAEALVHGVQILRDYEQLLRCLETSLRPLSTTQLECFMDLGFFPDHKRIRVAVVMDMWVEIHGLTENGVRSILQELSNRHLIELFERTGNNTLDQDESFNDLFIVHHDLLSELAVHVSGKTNQKRLIINQEHELPDMQQQNFISQSQIVSILTGEMRESDWFDLTFPCAEVLILNFSSNSYHLPPFLERMENLKVLIITNSGMTVAEISGLPPSEPLKYLRRVRLEKISLPIECNFSEPFQGLHKLSMVLCEVNQEESYSAFDALYMFPMLKELEIDYCNGLERVPPKVCEIGTLQKLSITNCHDLTELSEDMGRLSELQVLRLQACSGLECLPESLSGSKKLRFLDLANCSSLSMLPESICMLRCLRKIDMRGCSATVPISVRHMVGLTDVICDPDNANLWEPFKPYLIKLKLNVLREKVHLGFLQ